MIFHQHPVTFPVFSRFSCDPGCLMPPSLGPTLEAGGLKLSARGRLHPVLQHWGTGRNPKLHLHMPPLLVHPYKGRDEDDRRGGFQKSLLPFRGGWICRIMLPCGRDQWAPRNLIGRKLPLFWLQKLCVPDQNGAICQTVVLIAAEASRMLVALIWFYHCYSLSPEVIRNVLAVGLY